MFYQGTQAYKDTECPDSWYLESLQYIFLWVVMQYLYVAHTADLIVAGKLYW